MTKKADEAPVYGELPLVVARPRVEMPSAQPDAEDIRPIGERLASDLRFAGRGVCAAFLDSGFFAHPDLTQPRNRIRHYHDLLGKRSGQELIQGPDASSWHGMMTSCVAAGNGH